MLRDYSPSAPAVIEGIINVLIGRVCVTVSFTAA